MRVLLRGIRPIRAMVDTEVCRPIHGEDDSLRRRWSAFLIFLIYNSKIPPQAKIGKGSKFGYGGISVVIHQDSVIGENCSIGQLVTIGGGNSKYPGVPTIGDNVRISCGSIVFGGFTVGNNVVIGAHSVVNFPVPDNAVVVGNPGRIVRIGGEKC